MLTSGTWMHHSLTFLDHREFMCIDRERQRIISSVFVSVDPERNSHIDAWYREVAPGQVDVRLRPDEKWRRQTYRSNEGTIYWHRDGHEYPWEPADKSVLPAWWPKLLREANRRMDELEAEVQRDSTNKNA